MRGDLTIVCLLPASAFLASPAPPLRQFSSRSAVENVRVAPPQASLAGAGAALFAGSGAFAWAWPEKNLAMYGLEKDSSAVPIMRAVGAWQLNLVAALLAGRGGVVSAAGFSLLFTSLTTMAILPVWETLGRPKGSTVGAAAVFAVLGKLTLVGKVSPLACAAIQLAVGALIHFTPVSTGELYELTTKPTAVGHSMIGLTGSTILVTGAYLAALALGLTQLQSFATLFATNAVFAAKWAVTEAKGLGAPKTGALAWAAVSAALTALALK